MLVIVVNVATPVTLLRETYTVFRNNVHILAEWMERPYSRTEVYVWERNSVEKSFASPSPRSRNVACFRYSVSRNYTLPANH